MDTTLDVLLPISSRKIFDDDIQIAVEEVRTDEPLGLVMVDVDHFKEVNDRHGHQIGDEVLKITAETIHRLASPRGKVYRYGGEEIAVLLPNSDINECIATAERIRKAISRCRFSVEGLVITASFGVSVCDGMRVVDVETFVRRSDEELYKSKEGGRNRVTPSPETNLDTKEDVAVRKKGVYAIDPMIEVAKRIEAQRARKKFLNSDAGVAALRLEYDRLFVELERVVKSLMEKAPEVKVSLVNDRGTYFLYCDQSSITTQMNLVYGNTLEGSDVNVGLWKGAPPRSGQMSFGQKPEHRGGWKFELDRSDAGTIGWRNSTIEPSEFEETSRLAEFILTSLLRHTEIEQRRK